MPVVREYVAFIRGFSRDAKLYLWASALQSMAYGITMVVANLYFVQAGLTEGLLGALSLVSAWAALVFALPGGRAIDWFGRRKALFASGLVWGLGTVLQAAFPTAAVLVPATLLAGAASCIANIVGGPILVENSSESDRAHLFGFQFFVTSATMVVGSYLGGFLPTVFGGLSGLGASSTLALRDTFYVGAAMVVVSLIAVIPMRDERISGATGGAGAAGAAAGAAGAGGTGVAASGRRSLVPGFLRLRFKDRRLVGRLLLPQVLVSLGAGLIMPLQNVFMSRRLGATPAEIALIFAISSALTGFGGLAAPLLARRWGKITAAAASQFISLPLLAVMGLTPHLWVYGVVSLIRGSLMNMANPLISSFTLEVVESRERATVNSLVSMSWNLGWGLSSYIGGWMMQSISYTLPYAFTIVLYTASISSFYYFFRSYDRPALPPEPSGVAAVGGGAGPGATSG